MNEASCARRLARSSSGAVAAPQESRSAGLAKQLAQLMDAKKLDSIAGADSQDLGTYVAALYYPGSLVLIPPEVFLARPALWLRALSRHKGFISPAPNFAYGLCLKRVKDAELEGVDLSHWQHALNGAEPVSVETLRRFTERFGWHSLNNDVAQLTINGSILEFMGTNDAHRGWDRLDVLPGLVDALRELDEDDTDDPAVMIGVTHAPYRRVLDAFTTQAADVIFAGHTHGGQVALPGFGAIITNCDLPRERARGLSVWHHAHRAAFLNVSAGLGHSIYAPFRFACPPEAVLVTLEAGDIGYS